jgi:catechol 2,3-dioxygenase-like lactoylglutathione lyase family enzyme
VKIKGISWIGVGTVRFSETLRFFVDVMGLEVAVAEEEQALLRIADGQLLEIFGRDGRGRSLNSPPVAAFEVEDVHAAADELTRNGIELVGEVGSWNGFEWLYFRSPDGHLFAVKKTPPPGWERS